MQKLSGSKKIILLGLVLLIIAGIVVVALKGFNVSLTLEAHQTINLNVGKKIEISEIKTICKDVFKDKKVIVRPIDFFEDSAVILTQTITDEEKTELANKINEKYQTTFDASSFEVNKIPNVRIRDMVRPYVKPIVISIVVIFAYLIILFRKMKTIEVLGKILLEIVLTEFGLASIIAILRIPVSTILVNLMVIVAIVELLLYINSNLKKQKNA